MTKRANGEGNIKRRADGKWEARLIINGKRRSVYGKTQAEAMRKLKELIAMRDNEIDPGASSMTVAQWLEIWMSEYRGGIKASTKAEYAKTIRLHIVPQIGRIKLA